MTAPKTMMMARLAVPLSIVLVVWLVLTELVKVNPFVLPPPRAVWNAIMGEAFPIMRHASVTILEALAGLAIAVVLGLLTASVLATSREAHDWVRPIITATQSIPIIAVAPIFAVWFGDGTMSKAAMAAMLCWFPLVMNATDGMRTVNKDLEMLFLTYRANKWTTFTLLRLPSSIAAIVNGIRISAGLAVIGAIVAEYSGANQGLGYLIQQASYRSDTPLLFAVVLISCVSGFLLAEFVFLVSRFACARFLRR